MEFQRRVALGRLSEVFGAATLDVDRFLRTIGVNRGARLDSANLDPATKAALLAYCDGVNAFITTHRGQRPIESVVLGIRHEPWTITHSLAWVKMMRWSLETSFGDDLVRQRLREKLGAAGFAA
jgi:penicillin amidase